MPSYSLFFFYLLLLDHLLPGGTTTTPPLGVATARAAAAPRPRVPVWFLAGDSTTALQSNSGGGWGAGFLSFVVVPGSPDGGNNNSSVPVVESTDYAVNGATTASFVADGYWARVLDAVGRAVGASDCAVTYEPFVTIQFGHNDQKKNVTLDEYQANLETLAGEVKAAGGTPVLVTPLARRVFTGEHNLTRSGLADQRAYTRYAAGNTSTWWVDLNKASSDYVETIGQTAAERYDLVEGVDKTHLNDWGSVVFGRMVADLVLGHPPVVAVPVSATTTTTTDDDDENDQVVDNGNKGGKRKTKQQQWLARYFAPNQTLSDEIWGGLVA